MKRIVIVCILLTFCVATSAYSLHRVTDVTNELNRNIGAALGAMAAENQEELTLHIDNLLALWHKEEDMLIRLVRHAAIDDITKSMARLTALNAGRNDIELVAELSSIRWQMEHIYHSEQMLPQNLL